MKIALTLLAVAACLLLLPLSDLYIEAGRDEGSFAEAAYRMICGEMPHRDFHTHFPHLPTLEVWLAYKALGVTVFAPRLVGILQMFGLAALVYVFACRYLPKVWAFAVALLILDFNALSWPVVSHHWQSTFCLLALALALFQGRVTWAGMAWGGTLLTAQQSFAVASVFLLAYRRFDRRLLLGMAAVTAPYLLWLAFNGALPGYLQDNFARLGGVYESSRDWVSPQVILMALKSQSPPMEWWAEFYSLAGLYIVFMGCAVLSALVCRWPGEQRWLALLAALHAVPLLAYHFKPTYFNFVDPLLYLAVAAGVPHSAGLRRAAVALLVFAHSFWWAVLGCVPKYFRHAVQLPAGTLYCLHPQTAQDLHKLNQVVQPHERIWISPVYSLSHIGPLLHKKNSSPYFNLRHFRRETLQQEADRVRALEPTLLLLWKVTAEQQALVALYGKIAEGYQPALASEHWLVLTKPSTSAGNAGK